MGTAVGDGVDDLDEGTFRHPMVEMSPDGHFVAVDGLPVAANRAARRLFGLDGMDGFGAEPVWSYLHPDDRDAGRDVVLRAASGEHVGFGHQRVLLDGGGLIHLETAAAPVRWHGRPAALLVVRDIRDRVRQAQQVERLQERLATVVDNATVGMALLDHAGIVTLTNPALIGLAGGDPTGRRLADLLTDGPGDHTPAGPGTIRQLVDCRGGTVTVRVTTTDLPPDSSGAATLVQLQDATAQVAAERLLHRRATTDGLTGLPNRDQFVTELEDALARPGAAVGVLFIDLDRFKLVNDSHGHSAGDALLAEVARRMADAVRPDDLVARFGGDEFTVLCRGIRDTAVAERIVQRLRDALTTPVAVGETEVHVRLSVGLTLGGEHDTADDLLSRSDAAMYEAKRAGRDRTHAGDPDGRNRALERLTMEGRLRTALTDGDLRAHLQPVVDMRTGAVLGAECLARWTLPDGTVVPPDVFVPLAGELGLAPELDLAVSAAGARALAEAQAVRPPGTWPLRLGCNLEPSNLLLPGFVDRFLEVLASCGLQPELAIVELTERRLTADTATLLRAIAPLRDRGIRLAIDDFGTGESSLARLTELPAAILKLDRAFILQAVDDRRAGELLAGVVDLARRIDLDVVAEGVEVPAMRELLLRLGCTSGQGWLFHRDLAPADFRLLVADSPATAVTADA
jgi:diguanylate cyclase (GGDEF)-like protein/PAS domain S-box-containing protein